jgi:hypothetical protein
VLAGKSVQGDSGGKINVFGGGSTGHYEKKGLM